MKDVFPEKSRIMVAMSGGVDSSVAAALLVHAGFRVEGVMLKLWHEPGTSPQDVEANRCCAPDAVEDARQVAGMLGIPFRTLDVSGLFRQTVVRFFIDSYSRGLTPNPCLLCNRQIRFGFLLDWAQEQGADYLASGHYVRVRETNGRFQLLRGLDPKKDQSYVLHMLNQTHLPRLLFPLGDHTKEQIRSWAREMGLPVADRPESQDICFLADSDYRGFLRRQAPEVMRPGPIVDESGHLLGQHMGVAAYTIGQRKGLRVSASAPLYVLRIDPPTNTLIVGPRSAASRTRFTVADTNWVSSGPPENDAQFRAEVRIRYRAQPAPAWVVPGEGMSASISLDTPLSDITPGQAAVFYHDQACLGGGTITINEAGE